MLYPQLCVNCYFRSTTPKSHIDGERYFCENPTTKEWARPIFEISGKAPACSEFIPLASLARVTDAGHYLPPPRWGEQMAYAPKPVSVTQDVPPRRPKKANVEVVWTQRILLVGAIVSLISLEIEHTWPQLIAAFHVLFP